MTIKNTAHKAGYVAVMGRPNVGKSTLVNTLIGQKIAAVSPKPQTTRKSQLGILTLPGAQIIFVDTPGLHHPQHRLGEYMNKNATEVLEDTDIVLFCVDGSEPTPHQEDLILVNSYREIPNPAPMILAINKIDRLNSGTLNERAEIYSALYPEAQALMVSAVRGDHLKELISWIIKHLPESPPYYPRDQITDLYEREIAADLIRAAGMLHLRDEVPHAIAIRIDEYTQRTKGNIFIAATVFVERDSQKGIVIGSGGKMLKRIGSTARREIEAMAGEKVFLQLRVKVRKNWRNNENELQKFGF